MAAHLHGRLGYAGDLAALFFDMSQVAAYKDFRMTWRIQVTVDDGAAALIRWSAQHLAQRRGLDAGSP